MSKRILSLFLVLLTIVGMLAVPAGATSTLDEAMKEVNVYARNDDLNWLTMNGSVKTQHYTYYNYVSVQTGQTKEIPAYCVDPRLYGVPALVEEGTAIQYSAESTVNDPKVCDIIANGYPHMDLATLGLNSVEEAYYATKTALWVYLLGNWSLDGLGINPKLTGADKEAAQRVLQATKDIYWRGMQWNELVSPKLTATADRNTAYPVTINGESCYQQVITITSETWAVETMKVSLAAGAPSGAKILDMDNKETDHVTLSTSGNSGYQGQCKIVYPASAVEGQTGTAQLNLNSVVVQYAIYYARSLEMDKYGNLQDYMLDTDPRIPITASFISRYSSGPNTPDEPGQTGLKIVKLESGTDTPLEGAVFEVLYPDGSKVGSFSTDRNGEIKVPLNVTGNYTVTELIPPENHLLAEQTTQNVTVVHGQVAELTFWNEPYGNLRVEKRSDTGEGLEGVTVQIKNIETGTTQSGQTGPGGVIEFTGLKPGGYEVRETAGIAGWQADTNTVQTVSVSAGETSTVTMTNKELPGLRIVKYDRASLEVMPDVTFELWRDGEYLGQFQTDQMGEILLLNVKPGTYMAKEVQSDDAHILDTTPQQVELKAGDGIKQLVFFNDRLPGIHLIKVDSSDLSKPIANARFRFEAVDGSYGPVEYTTQEDGTIDLSKLPAGAYVVTELSCPGYLIDDGQRIIQLRPNEEAQFVFTNSIKPTLQLIKLSSVGSRLPGVTFRIAKIEDGSHYLDRTTNAQGEILVSDLEPGVYSVKETATTSNHIIDVREYHVELFPGKTSTLVIENQKRPNLIVYKHDADTGEPIANTVFQVRAADGHSVDEIRTDEHGRAELRNLLPGVYEITEKSVPSPYLPDAPSQLVTLYPNRDHTVYFENHQKPSLTVNKICSVTGDPLEGAKFRVTYASSNTDSGEINDLGIFYTDENGQFKISGLKDGWYKVTELESVPGYSIQEPAAQEVYIQSGTGKTLTFENIPLSALVVWKYDSVTGEAVSNAVFQVKYLTGTSGTGGTVIGTYKTSANGSFTVTGLKEGTYIVEELASDSGHVIDTPSQTAYISGKDQDVVQLYFGNSPKGSLLIKKIDSVTHESLSDVEFFVMTSDGTVVGNGNGKFTTDSAGSILIENIDPGTTLVVKETRAKDGYVLDDAPQTAKIKAGETVTLEFRNAPKGSLVIVKKDAVTGKPLKGVAFTVTTSSGQYVPNAGGQISSNGIYYTDEAGQIILSGLAPDTYVVTETESIPGYVLDSTPQTVVVNANDTQTLTFTNKPTGGLIIIKRDEDSGKRISGVQFEVRKMNGEIIGTYTTDRNGVIQLPDLESGWYTVTERKAASGYLTDTTPQQVEIKDGQTSTLELTNRKAAGILLHKVDADTGEGIYGAVFLLYDSSRNPIGQYVTDQDGYVYVDEGLKDGRYYIREIKAADGYVLDDTLKTIYIRYGSTTEIEWKNTAIRGQIQIIKKSANDNPINGLPAGTLLEGAVFEIYDKAGNVVDTIRSDSRGRAVSKQLPLSRYTIREVKAPDHYAVNPTVMTAYLEHEGQIVTFEVEDDSISTGVSIKKTGPVQVMPGQPIKYTITSVGNTSTVALSSFYWRDTLPAQVRVTKLVTGTYNQQLTYKIVYQTNLSGGSYRTLADNLSTTKNYVLDASPAALGLAANERVTEVMYMFGTVKAGFGQVETPYIYGTVIRGLSNGSSIVNAADVGGLHNGQWIQAVSRWVTNVYAKTTVSLPKTGY